MRASLRRFFSHYPPPGLAAGMAAGVLGVTSMTALPVHAATLAADNETYRFDANLFRAANLSPQALARFNQPDAVPPGEYALDVYVNERFVAREDIRFAPEPDRPAPPERDNAPVRPAISREMWLRFGVAEKYVDTLSNADTSYTLNLARLRLDISIPQSLMAHNPRGAVNPAHLDAGASMLFVNYSGNAHHVDWHRARGLGAEQDSGFLSLNGGVNLGRWQFRHQGSLAAERGQKPVWASLRSFVQRPLPQLGSQLTLGQTSTSGRFFSAVNYVGLALETDVRMRPDSQRGYAPTVRGVALGNARVTIRQNDQEIYQTTVAAGPFVIDDLYPTAYNGDLQVEVLEADGSSHTFGVPFAAVPESLRPGNSRYQFALGRTRNDQSANSAFADFTYERGVSNSLSANGGVRAADRYLALAAGGVAAGRFGALGLNLTYTRAQLPGAGVLDGWMAGLSWSRSFAPTGTQFSLAGYRYSTRGYRELSDVLGVRAASRAASPGGSRAGDANDTWQSGSYQQKSRFEASISQPVGALFGQPARYGNVYLSGASQFYRDGRRPDHQWQAGYSHAWDNGVSMNFSYSRQKDALGKPDQTFMLSLAVPLGARASGSYGVSTGGRGGQHQLGVSGTLDDDHAASYSVGVNYSDRGKHNTTWNASVNQRLASASVSANASGGRQYWQAAANVQGALALHAGGVTFGPYLSDTFALVHAPGATGARLPNAQGARIDGHGYALVPALTPYRYNSILLDPQGIEDDVELEDGALRVAPYAGAAVQVEFRTRRGQPLLIATRDARGAPLPLGADALDADGHVLGMVGQHGLLYVRVPEARGALTLVWGNDAGQRCQLRYDTAPNANPRGTQPPGHHGAPQRLNATCQGSVTARTETSARSAPHTKAGQPA